MNRVFKIVYVYLYPKLEVEPSTHNSTSFIELTIFVVFVTLMRK